MSPDDERNVVVKKKQIASILVILMVCSIIAVPVSAAHGAGGCFTDRSSDGICDNRVQCSLMEICHHRNCSANCDRFVDADGDGICDHRGQGSGYADANQDGICDNRRDKISHHAGHGHHRGRNHA